MIKGKKILLTGGAGFIGTQLSNVLYIENEILIYDNLKRNSIRNTELLSKPSIRLEEGDILDYGKLKKTVNDFRPDVVVHLAAIAGVDSVINNPINTMKTNMIGTYNLLDVLTEYIPNMDRFIDFSTSEVFGSYAFKVNEQTTTNLAPVGEARWTYSISKLASEHLTHSFYKEYGLPAVSIRPFNIYGPGQVGEGAIHQFVVRAIKNEDLKIHGDGDQIRSWCYIDDFISGVLLCMEKKDAIGNAFNIGNPRGTITIAMLAQLIKMLSNSESKIVYIPKNYVDVELRIPSIDKAKSILEYEPIWDLNVGLLKTIEWYRGLQSV